MTVKALIAKSEKEVAADRHWRAKEMLRSSIPNYGYDLTLIRKLADVLMEMKDAPTAGKFLFLSVDEPDEQQKEAIDLFVERFSQRGYQQLIRSLPKRTRMAKISDYPKYAQAKFRELSAPEDLPFSCESESETFHSTGRDWGCWIFLLVALAFVVCAIVGAVNIVGWLSAALTK